MPDPAAELSPHLRARLDALRERGIEVIGPTPSEDTAGHPPGEGPGPEGSGWTVVLHVPTSQGSERSLTGAGASADAAAEEALARIEHAGPPGEAGGPSG